MENFEDWKCEMELLVCSKICDAICDHSKEIGRVASGEEIEKECSAAFESCRTPDDVVHVGVSLMRKVMEFVIIGKMSGKESVN